MLGRLFRRVVAPASRRTTEVGWLLNEERGSVVYFEPERVRAVPLANRHPKSAGRCPAIVNMQARWFEVRCPFDAELAFARDAEGRPALRNALGQSSPVRPKKLGDIFHVTAEPEWPEPGRPIVQMKLPYVFVADEPVWMSQAPPFMAHRAEPLPGRMLGGRFPIHIWPRPLMWSFQWIDPARNLVLRRGEPLFYVTFESEAPDRPIDLVEAERTPELTRYMEEIAGAVNYVNQTFSLFKRAERMRPERLVKPRPRRAAAAEKPEG